MTDTTGMLMYHALRGVQAEAPEPAGQDTQAEPDPPSTKPDPDAKTPILRKTHNKEK